MPSLREIERSLAAHAPEIASDAIDRAAVAVVLREGERGGVEVVFIKRAEHPKDPWSGHMAFPGGRLEAIDAEPRRAAERETFEEVGLSLEDARYLGRLHDLRGRGDAGRLVVSAHVYHVQEPGDFQVEVAEVQEAFWFPVSELRDAARHIGYEHPMLPEERFPGVLVGEPDRHVVWGLTYRFLEDFLEICGKPLPKRWQWDADRQMKRIEPRDGRVTK